ncbi:MAG: NUDIX hydrolase [Verrucomicrobia bacterium]|nr:NUDIX hydrolase [Verrucomicrobiota bacterium]
MTTNATAPDEVAWACEWFEIVAKRPPSFAKPHYSIRTKDYVAVVTVDSEGRLLLVRQLRPAVDGVTLEFPCGHVEPGETPEDAARKELLEETGHVAERFELLANLSPDTGRLGNRMWVFFAGNACPAPGRTIEGEAGVDWLRFEGGARDLLAQKDFCSALNWAALLAAVRRGRLRF